MLTLNQTKFEAKLIFTWGGIALGVLIAFVLFFKVIGGFIAGSKPPPPPTVTFGKLPSVVFPQNSSNKSYTYSVDTVTGTLPAFPDRATVYKMTSPKPDLLALQNAKQKMSQAGFMSAPTLIAEGIYQWSDQTSINRKVVIELPAFNFKITSSYLTDPTVLAGSNLPDEAGAKSFTQTFLNNIALFPPDIDATKTATTLYSIRNGVFSSATSLSKSQIVRVDFYQKDVNN
ncbi:MAG TPA: hypothetical protein VLF68_00740, partial [Candidatus Saccharimonadales bacterium]|nr:hypothetical protein [Candidatus Saccharimonadales bacterium]